MNRSCIHPAFLSLVLLLTSCSAPSPSSSSSSSSASPGSSSPPVAALDAGPPPHAAFYEIEGVRWGMIPSEVLKTWGPGAKGQADDYRGKGGLASARLDFARMPLSDVIHDDVKAIVGKEDRVQFLTSITFYPGEKPEPKSQVRADLVARFGEPIADARLSSHEHCESPRCDLFRTGECTLARVTFLPSDRDLPERLDTLTHGLGCLGLIDHVQRVSWTQLRGVVRTSFAPELQTAMDNLPRLSATPDDALKALGSPNFREGDPSARLRLTYLWLDGSVVRLSFDSGRLQSVQSLVQTR